MMIKNRILLLIRPLLLLFLLLPAEKASSQPLPADAVRVISLSATGQDRSNSVAFSPDGRLLAAAGSAGIYLFDSHSLTRQGFIPTGTWVRSLAISPDGSKLAGGLFDNTAHLWGIPSMEPLKSFTELGGWVRSVVFSPDGRLLAAAAGNALHIWDATDGSLVLQVGDLDGIRTLAISPDGSMIALGLTDNSIQLRSLPDGQLIRSLVGHEGWVRCLAFSPDGAQLASGAFDATARLWEVETGRLEYTLADHDSSVLGIAFSPDGSMLATGSVDQTVRLWDPAKGTLSRTLVGHASFVYSVAFSPDGQMLASGANDNTVRLWNLKTVADGSAHTPETPSDCRACHHPLYNFDSVAVTDVRCDACHVDGLALNWCPDFPRSVGQDYKTEIRTASHEGAGLAIPGNSLAVTIFSPANGERVYSNTYYIAPLQLRGKVDSPSTMPGEINLRLEIWTGAELLSSLTQSPQPNGQFAFSLGVNPLGKKLRITNPSVPLSAPLRCGSCHDDYIEQAILPAGELRLRVIATTQAGEQATDERWITADVSHTLPMEVTIREAFTGQLVEGLTVQASTLLYEWRGRTSSAVSNADGIAGLNLEILSQAPTNYQVTVPDQVVNGIFYSGGAVADVNIDPQAVDLAPIVLRVRSQRGRITGNLQDLPGTSIPVWAVQLPAGPWLKTETDPSGDFSFIDVPIAKYVLFADSSELAAQGYEGHEQTLDLTEGPAANVTLEARTVTTVFKGTVNASGGEWLPFSWLVAPDGSVYRPDIRSGAWVAGSLKSDTTQDWMVSAPGYYSLKADLSAQSTTGSQAIMLQRRPELKPIKWGQGEIVVPPETRAKISQGSIDFESGWLWGNNTVDEPFMIRTDETEISISTGQFALERPVGGIAWFYLFGGAAEVYAAEIGEAQLIQPGEMIPLLRGGAETLTYTSEILQAFHPLDEAPLSPVWKPGFLAQLGILTNQTGVFLAQSVTFVTYIIAILSLIILPWLTIRWLYRHGNAHRQNK